MTPILLPVSLTKQQTEGYCLSACADMVLHYIGRPTRYKRLVRLLKIQAGVGTGFPNIRRLEQIGVAVFLQRGTIEQLYKMLQNGHPCIVFVHTKELPHSKDGTQHAIVVVGMDDERVWVNDPAEQEAPLPIPIGDFDLAWLEMREQFAVIIAG